MEIIIPGVKEKKENPFFEEILQYSKFSFSYMNWQNIGSTFPLILFQWPELVFNWQEPTMKELEVFQSRLSHWQQKSTILYLVHNERRHFGMTPNFRRLYDLVENSADVMVHFGEYSRRKYSKKYPDKRHIVIPHPLFRNSFILEEKSIARKKLNISEERKIIIAPGRIRNEDERDLVLKVFNYFPDKKKSLVVPYMLKKKSAIEFKGRYKLRKFIDVKKIHENWKNFFPSPKYHISYKFSSVEKLSLWMAAADGVLIPRIESLNSGNLYLGLTYEKYIIGPEIGNIEEVLEELNFPIFKPKEERSIKKAVIELSQMMKEEYSFNSKKLDKYLPQNVARKWDSLINEILENQKI